MRSRKSPAGTSRRTAPAARRPAAVLPFVDPAVEAAFAALPDDLRARLLALRRLILETARTTPGVGALVETLKWGEPAYLPKTPRVGTTVRLNALKGSSDRYAVYFHCQTSLIESFRERYPESFSFEGNRAIVFTTRDRVPTKALRHCIALALTYHLDARSR